MNYQTLVEDHIRKELPELMDTTKGCEVHYSNLDGVSETILLQSEYSLSKLESHPKIDFIEILGHPITIAHYLRVLGQHESDECYSLDLEGNLSGYINTPDGQMNEYLLKFSLTTQAPQSEEDWKKLAELFELV